MAERTDASLLFVAEWYDPMPMITKKYLLKYWPDQHMAEMVDVQTRRMFLKKSPCPPTLSKEDFYVGGKVLLYSRELNLVDYGDVKTREKLQTEQQQGVAVLTSAAYPLWGEAISELTQSLKILKMKSMFFSQSAAEDLSRYLVADVRGAVSGELSGGMCCVLLLSGSDCLKNIASVSMFVAGKMRQKGEGLYGPSNLQQSFEVSDMIFNSKSPSTATLDNCTCCIIKPHAVKKNLVGPILQQIIAQGYEISALKTFHFERAQAEEFLEVYKGVIPDYADHVAELCIGQSVALEVRAEDAVSTFRETAGPWDVELARELRPDTIRGRYGLDRVRSAVHCTDLPQDATLECEYCFQLMQ